VPRLLFAIFLFVPLAASAQQPPVPADPVVVTSGQGVVQAVPDRAFVTS